MSRAGKKTHMVKIVHKSAGSTTGRVRLNIYLLYRSDPMSDCGVAPF